MADCAPVMMWMSGSDGLCTFFNSAWLQFRGRTMEEEIGNGWAEGVHPEDLERCLGTYMAAFDARESFRMEYRLQRHDGTYRLILDIGAPLLDADGELAGFVGSCIDITERKAAEDVLRGEQSELKKEVLKQTEGLEQANNALRMEISERQRAEARLERELEINSALAEISIPLLSPSETIPDIADIVLERTKALTASEHGYVGEISPETGALVSHTLTRMMGDDCRVAHLNGVTFPTGPDGSYPGLWGHALSTREPFYTNDASEHDAARGLPNGHIPIEKFLSVPVTLGGELVGQISLANPTTDYTEDTLDAVKRISTYYALSIQRKRSETALRESERMLAALLRMSPIGIGLVESGSIRWVNETFRTLFGIPDSRETDNQKLEMLLADENQLVLVEQMYEELRSGEAQELDVTWKRADGSTFVGHLMLQAFEQSEPEKSMIACITDVTWRKQAEEKQAQLMEEVKHFPSIVSHDLRSPLVNLRGFMKELKSALDMITPVTRNATDTLPEDEAVTVREALDVDLPEAIHFMESSLVRMDHLISAILKLSRFGRAELTFEHLNVRDIVDKILESLAHQLDQKKITVEVGPLPDTIADGTAMEQILANLIDNAVKFLDPRRPGHIKITGWAHNDESFFQIQDNGIGIEGKDLDRVFRIFQRAGNRDREGEGMGLSYVRALVRRHAGRIWCRSQPRMGTTFTFTISRNLKEGEQSVS
jgi:PAS domain S-box-containing protein